MDRIAWSVFPKSTYFKKLLKKLLLKQLENLIFLNELAERAEWRSIEEWEKWGDLVKYHLLQGKLNESNNNNNNNYNI